MPDIKARQRKRLPEQDLALFYPHNNISARNMKKYAEITANILKLKATERHRSGKPVSV